MIIQNVPPAPTNGRSGPAAYVQHLPPPVPAPPPPRPASITVDQELGQVLSPSQANTYLDCPAKWWFKYGAGLPDPKTSSLAVGCAVDDALGSYFRARATGQTMAEQDVLDALDTTWADQEAETTFYDGEDPGELHGLCRRLVSCYLAERAAQVTPAVIDGEPAVQVPVTGSVAGVRVQGYIDLLTAEGTVIDLKTKKDKPGSIPPDHMLQISTYAVLCPHSRGQAQIDYMVKGRAKTSTPKIVTFTRDIGPREILMVESVYPAVQESIRNGVHLPRRTSRLCSRKYCAFWQQCQKEFGGEVAP